RKAVMLEVLRVLPGHESMWNWNQGVHATKKGPKTSHNEETGVFQVSADSMDLNKALKDFVQATIGATDDATFIARMKSDHKFAIKSAGRLVRANMAGTGPISGRRINGDLKKPAVTEFRNYLQIIGDFPPPPPGIRYA